VIVRRHARPLGDSDTLLVDERARLAREQVARRATQRDLPPFAYDSTRELTFVSCGRGTPSAGHMMVTSTSDSTEAPPVTSEP